MIIDAAFSVDAPLEPVFDALVDPQVVTLALAGARLDARGGDGEMVGEVVGEIELPLGDEPVVYGGRLVSREVDREAGAISALLDGRELRGGDGRLRGSLDVRLRAAERRTVVSLLLDIELEGAPASLPSEQVEDALRMLVSGLGTALDERLALAAAPRPSGVASEPPDWPTPSRAYAASPTRATATATATPSAGIAAATPRTARGRVEVVTDGPLQARSLPVGDGPWARYAALSRRRPWLTPAILLGGLAGVILLRRAR